MGLKFNPLLTSGFDISGGSSEQTISFGSRTIYVDTTNGNDSNNGSATAPYQTIQAALDYIGSAADIAEFNTDSSAYWKIEIAAGIYTESLSVPTRQYIELNAPGVKIVGNIAWVFDGLLATSTITKSKLVIKGDDSRNMYTGSGYPLTGVTGNITVNNTNSTTIILDLDRFGVGGNITFDNSSSAFSALLFLKESIIIGAIQTSSGSQCTLYASNIESSSSKAIGSVSGQVLLNILSNVRFVSTVVVNNGSLSGAIWRGVKFAAVANNFTGHTISFTADANSTESFLSNFSGGNRGSYTLLYGDTSRGVGYTPTTPGNWGVVPVTALEGLDELASSRASVSYVDSQIGVAEYDNGSSGASKTITFSNGINQKVTLTANCTFTFASPTTGKSYRLKLIQDGTGSRTAAWPGSVIWPGGVTPTLSTSASAIDIFEFYYDGTNFFGAIDKSRLNTDQVFEGANLYFTNERAQDAVGGALVDGTTVDFTYDDGANTITAEVAAGSLTNSHINASAAIAYSKLNLSASIVNADIASAAAIARSKLASGTANRILVNDGSGVLSEASALTNGQLLIGSTGAAPVAAAITAGSGISITNGAGSISISATGGSAGDIVETSFSAANNQAAAANVTGFAFANGTVRSFKALVSISIDATADLFESYELQGVQKGSSWEMSQTATGDDSGIVFTITTAGQVQYTSTNVAGFVSNTMKFRAITVSV